MKKYLWAVCLILLGAAFVLPASSTPAGACSIFCAGDMESLSGPTIVVLEGDENAETLEWSGEASIEAYPDGTVMALQVGDEYYYPQTPENTEEVD